MHVVIGADIGGTSTRVVVVDRDGRLRGTGRAGGGNLRSSRPADVTAHLADALADALADPLGAAAAGTGAPPHELRVDAAALGIAGAGAGGRQAALSLVAEAWARAGAPSPAVPVEVGDDLEIAFASAADGPDGLLLLAGTGAVACRVSGGQVVERCDGMGWLLGDEGSAVWLGLAALRAVAADLDGRGPATALTRAVRDALDQRSDGPDPRQDLIAAAYAVVPSLHGRLAPVVTSAALAGDAVAATIVHDGVEALLRTARRAAGGRPVAEVVVAGALLTSAGPVRDGVVPRLAAELRRPVVEATAPVVGAVVRAAGAAGWGAGLDRTRLRVALAPLI